LSEREFRPVSGIITLTLPQRTRRRVPRGEATLNGFTLGCVDSWDSLEAVDVIQDFLLRRKSWEFWTA